MSLDRCWAASQPPFQLPKVICYQGCLRPGAGSVPTQEAMKSLRSLGSGQPWCQVHSLQHSLGGWSVIGTTDSPEHPLSAVLGRCLGLDIHPLSLGFSLSSILLPAWSLFLPNFFSLFVLVCLFLILGYFIKCQVSLFYFWCISFLNFAF